MFIIASLALSEVQGEGVQSVAMNPRSSQGLFQKYQAI